MPVSAATNSWYRPSSLVRCCSETAKSYATLAAQSTVSYTEPSTRDDEGTCRQEQTHRSRHTMAGIKAQSYAVFLVAERLVSEEREQRLLLFDI